MLEVIGIVACVFIGLLAVGMLAGVVSINVTKD